MSESRKLIVFTRFPDAGKTKTRLIPHLGAEGAAQLQREMTEHIVEQARKTGAALEIRYTGGSLEQMREWLGDGLCYAEQGGGDLGERMRRAFSDHFNTGARHVVIVGSDCPSNGSENMDAAFRALEHADGVLGPTRDGGYYLIGLNRPMPRLFQGINWGGGKVLEQTLTAADGSFHLLERLNDVDLPGDLPERISVIIPTLNEEQYLSQTLEKANEGFNVETIVVDGGSSDGTCAIAEARSSHFMKCDNGRAAQQNAGMGTATGELLLFLHADTLLPDGWDSMVRETLSDPSVAAGAFSFKVEEQMRGMEFVERSANWRSRFMRLPYGDQGLFMHREVFEAVGGFPDMPIMEDYALVWELRRLGRIATVDQPAITSGRRWRQHGVIKVTLVNKLMILGYHLGISPDILARLYQKEKTPGAEARSR